MADGITKAFDATFEMGWCKGYHMTVNHQYAYEIALKCAKQYLSLDDKIVIAPHPFRGAEDSSFIAEKVPSNYLYIGLYNPTKGSIYANHSSTFKLDEESFKVGIANHYTIIHEILMQ